MRKLAVYCETLNHARAIHRWFQTQDLRLETPVSLINVLPAFAYSEIGEGAASFERGYARLQKLGLLSIQDLAYSLSKLGLTSETHLFVGNRAAELTQFCNTHAIDQICLVLPERSWLDRFMTQQLIKKLSSQTNATVTGVAP